MFCGALEVEADAQPCSKGMSYPGTPGELMEGLLCQSKGVSNRGYTWPLEEPRHAYFSGLGCSQWFNLSFII